MTFFDAPGTVGALEFWLDLGKNHKIMPEGTIEWGTLRQNFLEQKTAIMWHSTGNLTIVKNKAKFDFGVAMLPAKKRRGTPTGGGNFYIFKQTSAEERKAAMRLIKFMTSPERCSTMARLRVLRRLLSHLGRRSLEVAPFKIARLQRNS